MTKRVEYVGAVSPVEECPEIDGPHKANAEGRCVHCGEVVGL